MNYLNCTPSPSSQSTALLDSGCTAHFLLANAKCTHKLLAATPLEVHLPNGATVASTHTATLNLPSLPHASRQAHILPVLAEHSLLSMGKICDSGCTVTFTATKVAVKNSATKILTGQRDKESGLWRAPLENSISLQGAPEHYAQNVYEQKSIQDTITYLYACCFSPVKDTWLKAIQNGHFARWPSVNVENVRKYLPRSYATVKGHMNQIRQNIWSTQPVVVEPTPESDMVQEDNYTFIYSAIMETDQIYTDLACRFPTSSLSGNEHILILYDYYSNSILSTPMKNRGN
jgi:hypothetical protein